MSSPVIGLPADSLVDTEKEKVEQVKNIVMINQELSSIINIINYNKCCAFDDDISPTIIFQSSYTF